MSTQNLTDNPRWFLFYQDQLLLIRKADGSADIPAGSRPPVPLSESETTHHITPMENGQEVYAAAIEQPAEGLPTGYAFCTLRASYNLLPEPLYLKAGKCLEIIYWDHTTHYCGSCGAPMVMHTDISKRCTACDREIWPQLSTAIIVLIHRQQTTDTPDRPANQPADEVLLVHARNFKGNFYGLVAGFVETGETLEEAVHREVLEETGISITNLRYFGSQPWPYPCGLMVGFHADYAGGSIRLQEEELEKGNWFSRDNLPQIPEKLSIARRLIDDWLAWPHEETP